MNIIVYLNYVCEKFSEQFNVSFNGDKSQLIEFSGGRQSHEHIYVKGGQAKLHRLCVAPRSQTFLKSASR